MSNMDNGVAYFIYGDASLVRESEKILQREGIEVSVVTVPDYLFSEYEDCLVTSISDSFTAEAILESNKILIDNVHKEVGAWNA